MKSNKTLTILAAAFAIAASITACQRANGTDVAANQTANKSTDKPAANVSKPEAVPSQAPSGDTSFSLATPSDAYRAAYDLRKKKDVHGLKKVMSKDILEFFTMIGKEEGKSLDDTLKDLADKPQAPTAEVRNEKIMGDRAILEYLDEKGKWKEMDFEKEGNDWKLTFPKGTSKDDDPEK